LGDLDMVSTTMGSRLAVSTCRTATLWPTSKVGQMNSRPTGTNHSCSRGSRGGQVNRSRGSSESQSLIDQDQTDLIVLHQLIAARHLPANQQGESHFSTSCDPLAPHLTDLPAVMQEDAAQTVALAVVTEHPTHCISRRAELITAHKYSNGVSRKPVLIEE
jgi:hypothetical protein